MLQLYPTLKRTKIPKTILLILRKYYTYGVCDELQQKPFEFITKMLRRILVGTCINHKFWDKLQ